MKRLLSSIGLPSADQHQFYLHTGRIVLGLSILFVQLSRFRVDLMHPEVEVAIGSWVITAYSATVLALSFGLLGVKRFIYFFLHVLFYLLLAFTALQVVHYQFEMQVMFTYLSLSMFLCLFFHQRWQLLLFQVVSLLLLVLGMWWGEASGSGAWKYVGFLAGFQVLLHLAVGFRIDRGRYLRQQDAHYKRLFQRINDGIMYLDQKGVVQLVNEKLCQMSGYSQEELLGQHVNLILEAHEDFFSPAKDRQGAGRKETVLISRTGQRLAIRLNAAPMISYRGHMRGFVGICTDITHEKRAETELKRYAERLGEATKELEQFSYLASQDLRAPISTISSMVQVMKKKFRPGTLLDEGGAESIRVIEGGAQRMNQLVDALMLYSSSGAQTLRMAQVDMQAIVQGAIDNLMGYIQASDASIEVGEMPTVVGDQVQLTRLIQNLLENAIRYRKEERPIIRFTSSYDPQDGRYVFRMADNGVGIDPNELEEVFLVFQNLHKPHSHGLGIGLGISKKIIENHQGEIWLTSEKEVGTQVYFTLPEKESAEDSSHADLPPAMEGAFKRESAGAG